MVQQRLISRRGRTRARPGRRTAAFGRTVAGQEECAVASHSARRTCRAGARQSAGRAAGREESPPSASEPGGSCGPGRPGYGAAGIVRPAVVSQRDRRPRCAWAAPRSATGPDRQAAVRQPTLLDDLRALVRPARITFMPNRMTRSTGAPSRLRTPRPHQALAPGRDIRQRALDRCLAKCPTSRWRPRSRAGHGRTAKEGIVQPRQSLPDARRHSQPVAVDDDLRNGADPAGDHGTPSAIASRKTSPNPPIGTAPAGHPARHERGRRHSSPEMDVLRQAEAGRFSFQRRAQQVVPAMT